MGVLLQVIGVTFAFIGLFSNLVWLFIVAGFFCLFLDINGFLSGTLNLFTPILFYIMGWIRVGNWTGILLGSVMGNSLELIFILAVKIGLPVFFKIKSLFSKNKE